MAVNVSMSGVSILFGTILRLYLVSLDKKLDMGICMVWERWKLRGGRGRLRRGDYPVLRLREGSDSQSRDDIKLSSILTLLWKCGLAI
jgi:hypothetical protein